MAATTTELNAHPPVLDLTFTTGEYIRESLTNKDINRIFRSQGLSIEVDTLPPLYLGMRDEKIHTYAVSVLEDNNKKEAICIDRSGLSKYLTEDMIRNGYNNVYQVGNGTGALAFLLTS